MDLAISYAVPADSLRIFHGFRNDTLTDPAFRKALGQTFMPGTPYMLAPLGLSAYLPGVVVGDASPEVPNEFAIIAYPSQQVWKQIMNDTLRGRVYNSTHGGVYDLKRSGASFPIPLKHLPALATDPYYVFDGSTDWQSGVTRVFVGAPADNTVAGGDFRQAIRSGVEAALKDQGLASVDQCVVMPGDGYAIIWFHSDKRLPVRLPDPECFGQKVRTISTMDAERVVCRDEPPVVMLDTTSALNFVFLREPRMFLS